MPDYIGDIEVPEITPSGTFPLISEYPYGRAHQPQIAIHQFGSANAKIEQRFLLGTGAKRFTIRKSYLHESDRTALRDFWENHYGPYGAFTYNAPDDDGNGTTPYTCRFANEPLSWEFLLDAVSSIGITLIEIPPSSPNYTLNQTLTRFPSSALETALLSQVQEIIRLIKIQLRETGYPTIYLSDRRCTIGGQLYQARLLEFDGISQSLGNESDEAKFIFGNADRVMRELANDTDLFRGSIEFSLFHVGTGIKLDLWRGEIIDWNIDAGPEFSIRAADGIYELNLPYPTRRICRTCWKLFDDGLGCPFTGQSTGMDYTHFPDADDTWCDKSYDGDNGCLAHGMKHYFGGILAEPQGVRVKDNSKGTWGYGRPTITSVSLVNDSIYDQVIPEIYTNNESWKDSEGNTLYGRPINCKIGAGRDESDFYEALGIVGEGPITFGVGHKLDAQYHHTYPSPLGRVYQGTDPAGATDFFSLDEYGDKTSGDWRKVYSGNSTYKDNFAAGTAFLVIRRNDEKGIQLSRVVGHDMQAIVLYGLQGWVWTAPGTRSQQVLSNPIWIAVNMLLRARGLRFADAATAEQYFDVNAAIAAASICDEQVEKLIGGAGYETQFKFQGMIEEDKPLRDWIQEVLMNCLGYYSFAFGKLKLGIRINSSVVEAFTEGNILFRSLQLLPLKPSFNHIMANFGDSEFNFAANSVTIYDSDYAKFIGGATAPLFLRSHLNLSGVSTKSQAARIASVRLREELGGINADHWKAARQISLKTTVLALNTEPGMVCSMTHPDMPDGWLNGNPEPNYGEFRVTGWKLNKDYSIDIQGQTTVDEMYDLLEGPKPADVIADGVPIEPQYGLRVPEELYINSYPIGADVRVGAGARKWYKSVFEAELRAKFVSSIQSLEYVDLRKGEEGGTFTDNGTTQIILTEQGADWRGFTHRIASQGQGRWYWAAKLRNLDGWSTWTDKNTFPEHVTHFVDTELSYDTGPPAGWSVTLMEGANGEAIVRVRRPTTNGNRLLFIQAQIKDASTYGFVALDANSGPAVTKYDGSAVAHTYDKSAGTISKASGDWGTAEAGDLICLDRRGGQFDVKHCLWGFVVGISGQTLTGLFHFDPDVTSDLRLKIVKPPWTWDDYGHFGGQPGNGFLTKELWENGGDTQGQIFDIGPIPVPSGVNFDDLRARVWISNVYSYSDDDEYSGPPSSGLSELIPFINVKEAPFFAKGDDETDDTEAIQKALDEAEGAMVLFPTGTYKLTDTLILEKDNVILQGPGTLSFVSNDSADNRRLNIKSNNVKARNLNFFQNGSARFGNYGLVSIDGVDAARYGIEIEGCEIEGGIGTGIHCMNAHGVRIANNYIHNCYADGIHIQRGSSDIAVANNVIVDIGDDAIGLVSHAFDTFGHVQNASIIGNVVGDGKTGTTGGGIGLVGAIGVTAKGNAIKNTQLAGFRIAALTADGYPMVGRLAIIGNTIQNTGILGTGTRQGISVFNGRHIVISGNQISDSADAGISLGNSIVDVVIEGNEIVNSGSMGIYGSGLEQVDEFLQLWTDPLLSDDTSLAYVFLHNISVINNVIRTAGTTGIQIEGLPSRSIDGLRVFGNKISRPNKDNGTAYGLRVRYADKVTIFDNDVRDPIYPLAATWHIDNLTNDYVPNRNTPLLNDVTPGAATFIGLAKHYSGGAAPTTGSHTLGDTVWNWSPVNGILCWVCVASGSPGTWTAIPVPEYTTGFRIGPGTVEPSAMLDVYSLTQGFLPPRMSQAQRDAIGSPADGLILWNQTNSKLEVYRGGVWDNLNDYWASAAPSSGTHEPGEFYRNVNPINGVFGWLCVAAGTPGTWAVIPNPAYSSGIGIGTLGGSIAACAILHLEAADKGLLLPRTPGSSVSSPIAGVLIYDTGMGVVRWFDGANWNSCIWHESDVSVNNEIVLFSGGNGKIIKRASGSGIVKVTNGVYSTVDPLQIGNGGTGANNVGSARTNLDVYSKAEVDALIAAAIAAHTHSFSGTTTEDGDPLHDHDYSGTTGGGS